MSLQVEKLEKNMAKLTVEVPAEQFVEAIGHAYKKNKNRFNVPGFRKGKVPQAMIEKMYGSEVFYEDAANEVIGQTYGDAAKESGLDIVSRPSIDLVQIEKGKNFIYTAEVAVKPEVTLGQYKGVEVEKANAEVTDEDVEKELKRAQEQNSRLVTVDDRPVADGDQVVIDFDGYVDGKRFDGGKSEDYPLTIGSHTFIDTFEDQLIGCKAGDEKDVVVTFPEEYHAKELAGKEATFKCKIHEVKETIKPELDDEFAKDVSEYDTLAALKKSIKADLAAKRQEAVDRDFENEAVVLAGKNMTCNIPACMIDEQVDKHLEQFAYQLQSQGMKMEDYLKMIGGDVKGMRDSMRPMAEQTVRSNILLSEIVHQENLDVTEEEVEEELKKMAEQYKMELDKIKEMVDVEAVKSDLKGRKAVKLIVDNAKPVEKEKKTAKKAAKKEDAAEAPAEEAKTEE